MSARGQKTLFAYLTDADALDVVARDGLDLDVIPTQELRPLLVWALNYFYNSGLTKAPTEEAVRSQEAGGNRTFGDILDAHEIALGVVEESIEWAIDDLKASYVHKEAVNFQRAFAKDLSEAPGDERLDVVANAATELVRLSIKLERRDALVDAREAMVERVHAYDARAQSGGTFRGMAFGIGQIDAYTNGIHPGELAIIGAPPKVGKSYMLIWMALQNWLMGKVPILFSLENTIEMTLDRIACLAARVDPAKWQDGTLSPEDEEKVIKWVAELTNSDHPLWVRRPDLGKRTIEHMVREAHIFDADCLLIDQLSWVEWTADTRRPKHERIGEGLHVLGSMIGSGRKKLPCVMAHQINREGQRKARKTGWLDMDDFAEAAEVERTADWAFGLFASEEEKKVDTMKFQTLAARRAKTEHFLLKWQIAEAHVSVTKSLTAP